MFPRHDGWAASPPHRPASAARVGGAVELAAFQVGGDRADAGGLEREIGQPVHLVAHGAERIAGRLADPLLDERGLERDEDAREVVLAKLRA